MVCTQRLTLHSIAYNVCRKNVYTIKGWACCGSVSYHEITHADQNIRIRIWLALKRFYASPQLILLNSFSHFCNIHSTPSYWWKTRKWLVMRQQIRRSKRSDGRKTQHIYSSDLNGSHYLNTTQSVADRQTGSDVGCVWGWGVWGGQLYRDVRCLLRVVSRFPHKPAIRWQGLSSRIRTSVQEGGLTQINTKLCIFSVLLT